LGITCRPHFIRSFRWRPDFDFKANVLIPNGIDNAFQRTEIFRYYWEIRCRAVIVVQERRLEHARTAITQ